MTESAAHAADAHPHVNYIAKFWWLVGLTATEVAVAVTLTGVLIYFVLYRIRW